MSNTVNFLENKLSNNSSLFQLLSEQLTKDFKISIGDDVLFTGQTPVELVEQVQIELERIISYSPNKMSPLLYRIDIAEQDIIVISQSDMTTYLEQLTYLVVKREFQKVYFKSTL